MLSQTDMQREIYEGREKARRDKQARISGAFEQGITRGTWEGMETGKQMGLLSGRVEVYQEVLGLPSTPRAELAAMSLEDLQRMADELRGQLGR